MTESHRTSDERVLRWTDRGASGLMPPVEVVAATDYDDLRRTTADEIEQLQTRCRELKVAYDRMFDKAAELERKLANG